MKIDSVVAFVDGWRFIYVLAQFLLSFLNDDVLLSDNNRGISVFVGQRIDGWSCFANDSIGRWLFWWLFEGDRRCFRFFLSMMLDGGSTDDGMSLLLLSYTLGRWILVEAVGYLGCGVSWMVFEVCFFSCVLVFLRGFLYWCGLWFVAVMLLSGWLLCFLSCSAFYCSSFFLPLVLHLIVAVAFCR